MSQPEEPQPEIVTTAPGDRLLRLREVEKKVGIARNTIYVRMGKGTFPRPLQLIPGAVRWLESEIDAWIASLPRAGGSGLLRREERPENALKDG